MLFTLIMLDVFMFCTSPYFLLPFRRKASGNSIGLSVVPGAVSMGKVFRIIPEFRILRVIVHSIIQRNVIMNLSCAKADNHILRDEIFYYHTSHRIPM